MKGSVYFREKENRYCGKFYFQGKRYYVYANSQTKCWERIRSKRKELKEVYVNHDNISKTMYLNTWFEYWLNTFKKQKIKESTYNVYLDIYNRHVKEKIGKIRINDINSSLLQNFINELNSYTAKKKLIHIFKELFDLLQKENYLKINPMAMVVLPKKNKDDKPKIFDDKVKFLNYYNELVLLNYLQNQKAKCYHIVKFILYTGLRRGEALGLTWKNVNLTQNTITVAQQWNNQTKKITSPKSDAAYRSIPLMDEAKDTIIELSKIEHKEDDFVFQKVHRLTQMLVYYSNKLNININPHMLRHTYASRCYAAGVDPKVIQKLLGHETIDTTLNTYTHVLDNEEKEIINHVRKFFIEQGLIIIR